MTENTFIVSGTVIDLQTRRGVRGLRVEAWDKDEVYSDLVGSAVTDKHGAFQMVFDDSYFQELFQDGQPDLFFKVFRDKALIKSTEDSVLWNVEVGHRRGGCSCYRRSSLATSAFGYGHCCQCEE
jgi:hypothetical protein